MGECMLSWVYVTHCHLQVKDDSLHQWLPGPGKEHMTPPLSLKSLYRTKLPHLMKQGDVVVVAINYRLGLFGFLDLSEFGDITLIPTNTFG
jgi:hypothetical protein